MVSEKFTAEDDADYASLIESLRQFLNSRDRVETSFSVEFVYKEIDTDDNLFNKLLTGVSNMYEFLISLNQKIGDDSALFRSIMDKIKNLNIIRVNTTDLFVDDYVYYSKDDNFERGSRIELRLPKFRLPANKMFELHGLDISLDTFDITVINDTHEIFLKTILLHAFLYSQQNKHIMDTIILIYDDNSLEIQSPFDTTIRTTAYRKINEIADYIIESKGSIKAVIVINEMWSYPNNEEVLRKDYRERIATEKPISLFACHMVESSLDTHTYQFESDKVDSFAYVMDILKKDIDVTIHMNFMNPIIEAFRSLKQA